MVNNYGISVPLTQASNDHFLIDRLGDQYLIGERGQQSQLSQLAQSDQRASGV